MSTQTPVQTKRKVEDTDFTPDKISYKISKTMDAEAANTVIEKTDMNFLKETGRFLPELLSSSELEITETIPYTVKKNRDEYPALAGLQRSLQIELDLYPADCHPALSG